MTLQRRVFKDGDSTSNGSLLKHSSSTNSGEVGKLQEECCCTEDGNGYVQFIGCPDCIAQSDCSCSSPYDYRAGPDVVNNSDGVNAAGCGATISSPCATTGFADSNACDSMAKSAVYILKDELNALQIDTDASGNPRYFTDFGWITAGERTTGSVTVFKIRVGDVCYPFIFDDYTISGSTDLSSCQIITAGDFLRDCAGNVMFYGSQAFGTNAYTSGSTLAQKRKNLCEKVCENRFWVNATPCDECGPCSSTAENDNAHYVQAEYAKGLFHIGCSSCSSCNPADASGKVVNGLGNHCLGNDSYTLGNDVIYKDPWNVKKESFSYPLENNCGKEYDGRAPSNCLATQGASRFNPFIREITSTDLGAGAPVIDCTMTCDSTTQNSPFNDCTFALSEGGPCGVEPCDCCCVNDFFDICEGNCSSTYSITCPAITLSASNNCFKHNLAGLGGGTFFCVDNDFNADCTVDSPGDVCVVDAECNMCELESTTVASTVTVSQPLNFGNCGDLCRWASPRSATYNAAEPFFPLGGSSVTTSAAQVKAHCDSVNPCPSGCEHSEVIHSSNCQGVYLSGVLSAEIRCLPVNENNGKYQVVVEYAMFVGNNGATDFADNFTLGPMFQIQARFDKDDVTRCPDGTYTCVAIGASPECTPIGAPCIDQNTNLSSITLSVS